MKRYTTTILTCMELNVENATTKAMRREAEQTLTRFREHVKPRSVRTYAPFERFLKGLEQ